MSKKTKKNKENTVLIKDTLSSATKSKQDIKKYQTSVRIINGGSFDGKHLRIELPDSVLTKKRRIGIIDFHNGSPDDVIALVKRGRDGGLFCITTQSSYNAFLSNLDNRQRTEWDKTEGELCIMPDIFLNPQILSKL